MMHLPSDESTQRFPAPESPLRLTPLLHPRQFVHCWPSPYLREAVACLRRNLPDWQDRPAGEITLGEAVRALDQLKESKGTVAANRTQAYARAAYSWAAKRQLVGANPLRGIERPGRESARERVLTAEELASIWRACDGLGTTRGAFVRTLMLTLQRREEVVSMRWTELDNPTDPTIWTLPGERAKNGKAHVVHLAEPVRAILRALPKMENNPFVFAGRSVVGPIAAFSATKLAIENAIKETSGRSIADWRFHDFRRAGVTALAGNGLPAACVRSAAQPHHRRNSGRHRSLSARLSSLPSAKQRWRHGRSSCSPPPKGASQRTTSCR